MIGRNMPIEERVAEVETAAVFRELLDVYGADAVTLAASRKTEALAGAEPRVLALASFIFDLEPGMIERAAGLASTTATRVLVPMPSMELRGVPIGEYTLISGDADNSRYKIRLAYEPETRLLLYMFTEA
ncbi:MAG: hypothetical protein BWY63_03089 [Chloroflexi bacterium ADurb.Bin360]|nr:MAG: hypothetical protein BWY63_03089 [Chloroflexi bacterium ADurb.Bin360]